MRRYRAGRMARSRSPHRLWQGALFALLLVGSVAAVERFVTPPITVAGAARIVDGDSLYVDGRAIRLEGIDAPEFDQVCHRGETAWACGRAARDHLRSVIADRAVSCLSRRTDRYDRLVARCQAGGDDLGHIMVTAGLAVSAGGYASEERAARQAERGLWGTRFVMPRDWRDGMRDPEQKSTPWRWIGDILGS